MNHWLGQFHVKHPLIVAPMAGGPSSIDLVSTCSEAGALGSIGAAYSTSAQIEEFVQKVRIQTKKPIAINLFIPHGNPVLTDHQIQKAIESTKKYRDELNLPQPQVKAPFEENFDQQFEAVLKIKPEFFSFVFGLLKKEYLAELKKKKIAVIGTATSVEEAQALEDSGVDAITLQGIEGGGHRGIFNAVAEDPEIPMKQLLQLTKEKVKIPLIAAGGIMDATDIKLALETGASAVQMGTAFLLCTEAGTSAPYRQALLEKPERRTRTTRVFSGRLARGLENRFMQEMENSLESVLPFPAQNKFTRDLRGASTKMNSKEFLSLWAGTGQGLLWTTSASGLIQSLFP